MTTVDSAAPARREPDIEVRRMVFEIPDALAAGWADEAPFLKSLLGALSVAFPPGERLFIDSVRHYLDDIEDPALRTQIRAFVGQEANHTKEHLAFNAFLERAGYPAKAMERWIALRIAAIQRRSPPAANLARTVALEHFTAMLADTLLENPEVLDSLHPEVARLWAWHAIEEIEHRAVAFDVYQSAVADEDLRLRTMRLVTAFFLTMVSIRTGIFLHRAGKLFDPRIAVEAYELLWGRWGMVRKVIPQYRAYYRRDFHPSDHDNSGLVERAQARYLRSVEGGAPSA